MYWTAASFTPDSERVTKWTSILNRVQDIHTHDDPIFHNYNNFNGQTEMVDSRCVLLLYIEKKQQFPNRHFTLLCKSNYVLYFYFRKTSFL